MTAPTPAPKSPQTMRPEDVPGAILAAALAAWTGYDDPLNECAAVDIETAATILAAAIPAIRAQVADEIAAARLRLDPHDSRHDGMEHAEAITRGEDR